MFVIVWFTLQSPTSQQHASFSPSQNAASPVSFNKDFSPDASNVSRSATEQLESLRIRVTLSPDDTMHVVRLARMLRDAHQVDEATTYYSQYLTLRPSNRQAWLDFAQSLGELNQWEDAEEATRTMLSHYPDDPAGLYNLGAIYANQGKIDEARLAWENVTSQSADTELAAMAQTSLGRLKSFLKP